MEAYFGMKAEESAKLQSATLGGPPVLDLVAKPYFVGGPETMLKKFEELRAIGVGISDLPFVIGTPAQMRRPLALFGAKILPPVQGWDPSNLIEETPSAVAVENSTRPWHRVGTLT